MIGLRTTGAMRCALFAAILLIAAADGARGQEPAPAAVHPDLCQRSKFRVVIDVGHTLNVPGAMSARGVPEYVFNLALAQKVKQSLSAAGFSEAVLLITATPPWRGLFERAARANALHADLFIAIHHDSVPDRLLRTWQVAGQQEHYDDDYPGYAIFISNDNPARAASLLFGRFLGQELEARGLQYTPHYTLPLMGHRRRELVDAKAGVYRYDQLVVLRATHMPAVLLEAGSIVNRQEELQLAGSERRSLTSAALVAAVEDFCAARAKPVEAKAAARVKQVSLHAQPRPIVTPAQSGSAAMPAR